YADYIIDLGLILLLFFVGIDIGLNKSVFSRIKAKGIKILLVPIAIIAGSILGSAIAGVILKLPFNEAGAIGAGLGWYSLSSILIASYSSELSALAFISNVIRELIAIMIIPIIANKMWFIDAIAPA
ncbi:lysine exporter LysO family protein, partial [Vibrio parahaemolyticus]|nr:lysine exporter LysO family protein [Vibrio parahaemolyticus]